MTLSFQDPSRSSSPYHPYCASFPSRFRRPLVWSAIVAFLFALFFFLGCNSTIHTHGGWIRKQGTRSCTVCPTPCPPLPVPEPEPEEVSWPPTPAVPTQNPEAPSVDVFRNDPFPSLPSVSPDVDFSEPPLSLQESAFLKNSSSSLPLLVIEFP